MVFSSLQFIFIFLPIVLAVYYAVPRKFKNGALLAFSLAFYYVGGQWLVLLLLASCAVNFVCSILIEKFRQKPVAAKLLLLTALIFSIGLLGVFKYADLVIKSVNLIFDSKLHLLELALPIGISFYTFQTVSYTIDVYRGSVRAERNFIDFAAFVTLFPQLIAGPIVRYSDISTELKHPRLSFTAFGEGVSRFCIGLGKKVLIANSLATLCSVYSSADEKTVLFTWMYAAAFTLQIYFDFSGYSDMAIGLGRMLGFTFPENFDYPYIAKSVTTFWRRWHMTLGSWFRDYVYIPLGGSRRKTARVILNVCIVWLLTGLWHGAEYTYILWGLYYGVLLLAERYLLNTKRLPLLDRGRVLTHIYMVIVTMFGFVLFNASSVAEAFTAWGRMVGIGGAAFSNTLTLYYLRSYAVTIAVSAILATPLVKLLCEWIRKRAGGKAALLIAEPIVSAILLVLSAAYLVDGSYNPFLYFQF